MKEECSQGVDISNYDLVYSAGGERLAWLKKLSPPEVDSDVRASSKGHTGHFLVLWTLRESGVRVSLQTWKPWGPCDMVAAAVPAG